MHSVEESRHSDGKDTDTVPGRERARIREIKGEEAMDTVECI
jgi:hypothetical protein